MRVGLVGTLWLNTPPPLYGGTEAVVGHIADGLVSQGHSVTLFAPQTAQTKALLSPTVDVSLRTKDVSWSEMLYHVYHFSQVFERANEFDVIHFQLNKHQDYMALPLIAACPTPVVVTLHFSPERAQEHADRKQLLTKYKDLPFTSISHAQQQTIGLNFIQTVYNSLNVSDFTFSPTHKDYFVWLGRIYPDKGTKEAILAAKKVGVKLILAGTVEDEIPGSKNYFEDEIKPLLDGKQITYVGPVSLHEKVTLLKNAKAMLCPIQWEEPFGLVMVESQICGSPVIAFNRGAAPEVIKNGETGYLVSTLDEMVEKMKQIDTIDRKACQNFVENTFSVESMTTGYLEAYRKAIAYWPEYQKKRIKNNAFYKDKPAIVTNDELKA